MALAIVILPNITHAFTDSASAKIAVTYPNNGGIYATDETGVVKWQASNYPMDAGVNVNLIKLTSESPKQYELVRVIAKNTANDGSVLWAPQAGEHGDNYFIEVTCGSASFENGCHADTTNQSFAMIDVPNRNLANPLSAFEKLIEYLKMELGK